VGASLIVVDPPVFNDLSSVSEGEEPVLVQALSRSLPLKLSMKPFWRGFSRSMKQKQTPRPRRPVEAELEQPQLNAIPRLPPHDRFGSHQATKIARPTSLQRNPLPDRSEAIM